MSEGDMYLSDVDDGLLDYLCGRYNKVNKKIEDGEKLKRRIGVRLTPFFKEIEKSVAEELLFKVADKNFLRVHDLRIEWNGYYHIIVFTSDRRYEPEDSRVESIMELIKTCKYSEYILVGSVEGVYGYNKVPWK